MSGKESNAGNIDFDRFRLRSFLARLEEDGELERRSGVTPLAQVARILGESRKAVLFENAGGGGLPLVGNALAGRRRMARAFGVDVRGLAKEVLSRFAKKPQVVEVHGREAPVQEVVATGDEIDLTRLPIHLQHGLDGGPYISAGLDFTINPDTGLTNVGVRRLMLRGKTTTGVDMIAPSDLRNMYLACIARGERMPIAFVVGSHPIDYFAGALRIPGDELGLIASLRGGPLPVVKCVSNDIRVPADAEWVLEGYLGEAGYTEPEGPFGEYLGYYGAVKINPVFHCTAVTRRSDAVFQTITIGGAELSRTDTGNMGAVRTEVLLWRSLATAVPDVLDVHVTPSSSGSTNARICLRQRSAGDARNAIAAAFGSLANIKNVFVVDPDIDIFSDEQMDWALATRFQPHRDLVVAEGFRTFPLDPSLRGALIGSKAGYDLTMAFGSEAKVDSLVAQLPSYAGPRFPSVLAALEHGPKSFEDLMAAMASDDGREIVRSIEALRAKPGLTRSLTDGKYRLVD